VPGAAYVFEGHVYRVVAQDPRSTPGKPGEFTPLDDTRAATRGGRCNVIGRRALYFSLSVEGAIAESLQSSARYAVGPFRPRLLLTVRVLLTRTCDALESELAPEELSAPWRDTTEPTSLQDWCERQALSGIVAITYPSVVECSATNIVVYTRNLGMGDKLEPISSD
jgi:RES domain-containing protein